jgi:riboflavin kinase/FMN adenylyltransferase
MITTTAERVDLFAQAGFEECFLIQFDDSIAKLTPQEFLEKLTAMGVQGAAVGATFRFGHKRAGDAAMMAAYFADHHLPFVALENITHDGERISSTRIRGLIAEGNLELADYLLGHSYELRGVVEVGFGRGHDLDFPTANISVPSKLLPKDGVYAALARYDGRDHAALVSIGTNPQFNGKQRTIEAWLRDFHETIYGRELALRDLRYLREQRLFASVDELVAQMRSDLEAVAYPSYG